MHFTLKHIDRLVKGKKSGANIGSRNVGHHLFDHEKAIYQKAMKYKFLDITVKHRSNLKNVWKKVCEAQKWDMWILEKNMEKNTSVIYKNKQSVWSGSVSEGKSQIKEFVK